MNETIAQRKMRMKAVDLFRRQIAETAQKLAVGAAGSMGCDEIADLAEQVYHMAAEYDRCVLAWNS